ASAICRTSCAPSIAPPGCRRGRSAGRPRASARSSKNTWPRSREDDRRKTEVIMYDHIGLTVRDLDASVKFYQAALAPLGHVVGPHDKGYAGIGPKDAPALWLYQGKGATARGAHVAFRAKDRAAVDRFHAKGLAAGGRDNGKPGLRADYSPTYYAAFL